jgi:site-specific DNA-methyltransferase (adenine-specific)
MSEDAPQSLQRDPANHNKGTPRGTALIEKSVASVGYVRPGACTEDGYVLAGNHLLKVAQERGDDPIIIDVDGKRPVFVRIAGLTKDDPRALQAAILDNRASQLNFNPDREQIEIQIQEVGLSPEDVGYTIEELRIEEPPQVVPEAESPTSNTADPAPTKDDEPVESADARCKPGDIWQMGPHRILCGDCSSDDSWRDVLNGQQASLIITSPPYADRREYDKDSGFVPIPAERYSSFWDPIQRNAMASLAPNGSFFVNIKTHCADGQRHFYVMDLVIEMARRWGWRFVDELCWVRHGPPGKWPNRLRNGWEPVYHFSNGNPQINHAEIAYIGNVPVSDETPSGDHMNGHWNRSAECEKGTVYPDNVIEAFKVEAGTGHTAAFPVKLPLQIIKAFSCRGDIVVDCFLGSGTTLIAAEECGRICCGMELSTKACDITIARWEQKTGGTAKLVRRDGVIQEGN